MIFKKLFSSLKSISIARCSTNNKLPESNHQSKSQNHRPEIRVCVRCSLHNRDVAQFCAGCGFYLLAFHSLKAPNHPQPIKARVYNQLLLLEEQAKTEAANRVVEYGRDWREYRLRSGNRVREERDIGDGVKEVI